MESPPPPSPSGNATATPPSQPPSLAELEARALKRTQELIVTGGAIIKRSAASPRVQFDLRGQSAGQFRIDAGGAAVIRYNRALLARHADAFLAQTVPHEVAHYLTFLRFGRRAQPHGQEWQQIMQSLGADPRRCHEFDVSGLKARHVRRFVYHCRCGDQELTSIRHHRIQRGAGYSCRRCGQTLQPGSAPTS